MIKGDTLEVTRKSLNAYLLNRRRMKDFERNVDLSIEVHTELLKALRLACFELKQKGSDELPEYRRRTVEAKTSLGNIYRLRKDYYRERNGTQVQNWFERARRATLGTP